MDEMADRLERACRAIDVHWDEPRSIALERRITHSISQQSRRRVPLRPLWLAAAALTCLGLVAAALLVTRGGGEIAGHSATVQPRASLSREDGDLRALELDARSRAVLLDNTAVVEVLESSPARMRVRLSNGGARFEVKPMPDRSFVVEAADVRVTVRGTTFTVAPSGPRTRVAVIEGMVTVEWLGGRRKLGRAEEAIFPPDEAPASSTESPSARGPAGEARVHGGTGWQALAVRGDYREAYRALESSSSRPQNPQELLLAADAARLSGHAAAAVPYLREVVGRHASDARAPLAAFTLGKVLLDDLKNPRPAGAAFEQARSLAPAGALAELALARAVEAYAKAGDRQRARVLAAEYMKRYPGGARQDAVKASGALE